MKTKNLQELLYGNVRSSFIHNSKKLEITQIPINRGMNNLWYICTIRTIRQLWRNELLMYAATCMILKDIMLSEINETQMNT